jgi:hypothetical protein
LIGGQVHGWQKIDETDFLPAVYLPSNQECKKHFSLPVNSVMLLEKFYQAMQLLLV